MSEDSKKKEPKLTKAEKKKLEAKQKADEMLEEFKARRWGRGRVDTQGRVTQPQDRSQHP